ncbi:hypothetical protein PybrP1_011199 [[Pythium] brassicae (nom. inval.)]|nr:hypothetical protein PybrP1_011199 [[Pythium] brassicae (nom. inval.)]
MGLGVKKPTAEHKPLLNGADYGSSSSSTAAAANVRGAGLGDRYPSQDATCVSAALFSWVTPVMELGNARPLQHEDLYQLDPANRAETVSRAFQAAWGNEAARATPSLTRALARTFGGQIAKAGLLKLVHDSLQFVGPLMIKDIIAFLKDPDAPLSRGLAYAGVVFVAGVVQSFMLRNYFFHCFESGMRVRSAICTAVYRKALALSAAARQQKTTGEITNLMSIDAQRLQELSTYINSVWFSVFQIAVACVLLYRQIGVATFAGVATYIYARSASVTLFSAIPSLVTVASFLTFVLLGNTLDVGTALTSLALFNILRFPLFMLPQVLNSIVEASVSIDRLQAFFLEEEREIVGPGALTAVGLAVEDADFMWDAIATPTAKPTANDMPTDKTTADDDTQAPVLRNITLHAKAGDLVAVVGHVGAGKSTLLSGILGDARCSRGRDADVYILDDILSAVDSHVGHDIFTDCVKGALKDKLVLLVTHGLTFLSQCDAVVVLEKGAVVEHGTYDALMRAPDGILTDLVAKYKEQDQHRTIEEVEDEALATATAAASHPLEAAAADDDDDVPGDEYVNRSRTSSIRSDLTHEGELLEGAATGQLVVDEDRSTGDVAWPVYKVWIDAFGGLGAGLCLIAVFVVVQGINLSATWWLSYWSEHAEQTAGQSRAAQRDAQMYYVYVFMLLNLAYAVALYFRAISTYAGGLRASRTLFRALLARLLRAPTAFFDTTPTGRIVNRLSKDVYTVDESIPATWSMLLNTTMSVLATLATISYVTPVFMVILAPVLVGYYSSQRYFIKTSRELQRLDSISRSPVFALLAETLDGLATIRAFGAEAAFARQNAAQLDRNQRAYFLNFAVNCWLALRLEFAGTLIASFAALCAVLSHNASTHEGCAAVEDAIRCLASRDAVCFDPGAHQWTSTIPSKAPIRTAFGEVLLLLVKCLLMRSYDGTVICSHPSGAVFLSCHTVVKDEQGNFVDVAFVPKAAIDPDLEASGYAETERSDRPSRIDLRGCLLDHSAMQRLSRGLGGNCFVKTLSLSGNQLRDSDMSLLASALVHNGCLTELNLSYNCIATLGSTLLATALAENAHVRVLDLMHNRIGRDGIHPWLGKTLRANSVLNELKLTHNDIGDGKACEMLASLGSAVLTEEELLKTQIHRRRTEMPAATISMMLPRVPVASQPAPFNTTLTTLLLASTGVSDEAAGHLAHVLATNRTLTHLDIASNAFTDESHEHIAIGLQHNASLRYLNYSDNCMAESAGVRVLLALQRHPALSTALFRDCFSGSAVAAALAAVIRATATLRSLDVTHCALEPPGIVAVFRALGENATLETLEMASASIKSDQAAALLAQEVARNTSLRLLDLSYNDLTLRGCKLLRDAVVTHGTRVFLSLEGNSGEKRGTGVTVVGGALRP